MNKPVIFYLAFSNEKPTGGTMVAIEHVSMLNKFGLEAKVVYPKNASPPAWLPARLKSIPYINENELKPKENDIVVGNEVEPWKPLHFPCKRAIFVQNTKSIWKGIIESRFKLSSFLNYFENNSKMSSIVKRLLIQKFSINRPIMPWKPFSSIGIDFTFTCSHYLTKLLVKNGESPVTIPNYVSDIFSPDPKKRIRNKILFLNRKNKEGFRILELIEEYNLDVQCLSFAPHDEMAESYQKADIFLATGYPEGFSLPPLEAMKSGSCVIGFSGGGGLEYMRDKENCLIAEDGNLKQAADLICLALKSPELREKLRSEGIKTASMFTRERTEKSLFEFFSAHLNG